jgi:hypothetical protein
MQMLRRSQGEADVYVRRIMVCRYGYAVELQHSDARSMYVYLLFSVGIHIDISTYCESAKSWPWELSLSRLTKGLMVNDHR